MKHAAARNTARHKASSRLTLRHLIAIICFALAGGIVTIPLVGSWQFNSAQASKALAIRQTIADSSKLQSWQAYNQTLEHAPTSIDADPFDRESTPLSDSYTALRGDNTPIGTLTYARLGIDLPIYWGTGEDALGQGAGHLAGTSLPLGKPREHSVISAHRADPTKPLFTRLGEAKQGDIIQIDTVNGLHTYKVSSIQVVKPDDTSWFHITNTSTLTLLTCTPYAVNTHRLLVTATLTQNQPTTLHHERVKPALFPTVFLVVVLVACVVAILVIVGRTRRCARPRLETSRGTCPPKHRRQEMSVQKHARGLSEGRNRCATVTGLHIRAYTPRGSVPTVLFARRKDGRHCRA